MSRELLPFAYDASQNATTSSQLLSTDVQLSQLRKREFPTSDSLEDFTSNKRFHEFTDDSISESLFVMNSSPPIAPVDENENELIDEDNEELVLSQWAHNKVDGYQEAISRIQSTIDNGASTIKLEELNLEEIPDEFGDLADLVIIYPSRRSWKPSVHAYLSNNLLHFVNPVVFDVVNITVLTLRNNKLTELPPAIGKLTSLTDLSIGGNRLEWLPIEIMHLKHLRAFSAHPNPFLPLPNNWVPTPTPPPSQFVLNRLAVESQVVNYYSGRVFQSLTELCLRILADNILNEREKRRLNLAHSVDLLVSKGLDAQRRGVTCFMCQKYMVLGIGHVFEWWHGFKGLKELVFRKNICSPRCYTHWKSSLIGDKNGVK
jgi:hypothetical protein